MKRFASIAALTGVIVALSALPLHAQAPRTPVRNPQLHQGFWFSGGLGYGSLGCQNCSGREGGTSGGLAIGGTISQRVLLGASTTGWTKSQNGVTLTAGSLGATIRFYPSETGGFFLRGDLGVGTIDIALAGFGSVSQTATSAVIGLGYDFRIAPMVSLTPYLNGVGMNWSTGDANYTQIGLAITTH